MGEMREVRQSESGQAVTEYILLLLITFSVFALLLNGLKGVDVTKRLLTPINTTFAHAYQYGHPKALGYDDGGPKNHPRAHTGGDNNFRIFYVNN